MTLNRAETLIALGSNQPSWVGNARETVIYAIAQLESAGACVRVRSRDYQTSAFPPGSGPDFVNAAIAVEWSVSPQRALDILHRIESDLGRERAVRWGPRSVDLDLIAAGSAVLPDLRTYSRWRDLPPDRQTAEAPDRLILPHPRLQDRAFVLVPLADVAPDWVHPVLGRDVQQMLAALDPAEIADVKALDSPDFQVVKGGE